MFLLLSLPAMPSISPSCGSFPRDDAVYAPPPPPYNFGILPRSSETTIICAAALRGSSRERENCAAHTYFSMQSSFASAAAERSAIIESKHAKQGGHAAPPIVTRLEDAFRGIWSAANRVPLNQAQFVDEAPCVARRTMPMIA